MTGKLVHDSEVNAHGQQVITACTFIHQEVDGIHKLFLARRAASKKFLPGIYELPGGHVDFGEDIVDGLKREIQEEFSVRIEVGDPFYVFTYTNEIKGSHSIQVVYFATLKSDPSEIVLQPEDHSECGWFAYEEAAALVKGDGRDPDDQETRAMYKGFSLLNGAPLFFA